MQRPLARHGVVQLEELFSKSKENQKVLKQLEYELKFRQVPRAMALIAEVQALKLEMNESVRPLMQHSGKLLKEMFTKSKADMTALEQLEHELRFRQVPSALLLLSEVQAILLGRKDNGDSVLTRASPSQAVPQQQVQQLLFAKPTAPAVTQFEPKRMQTQGSSPIMAKPSVVVSLPPQTNSTISVADACKVLNTTLEATWESLEQTRRLMVEKLSPSKISLLSADERAQALVKARLINEAHKVLTSKKNDQQRID